MSVVVNDVKVALRDFLRSSSTVTDVVPANRIVLSYEDVVDANRYIVLSRSGGVAGMYNPFRTPRVDIVCFGRIRWHAAYAMHVVSEALGLHDPLHVIFIHHAAVRITSIIPENEPIDGINDQIPNAPDPVPFVMRSVRLVAYYD